MKHKILYFAFALLATVACDNNSSGNKPQPPVTEPEVGVNDVFARGADISWVTEMEASGHKFRTTDGQVKDCFELMKDYDIEAVRLRVWVDPSEHGNWCNTEDLVAKAKRAKALGMDVMVDFHYSDWWADPNQQHKPAAWKKLNLNNLRKAITNHTTEVLAALKVAGVTPKWVQVGNEIRPGMLWDEDANLSGASYDIRECDVKDWGSSSTAIRFRKNLKNLADFINAGYYAVKSEFKDATVIVHLDNGYDNALYTWFFDELKKNGGHWDMIGMSIYPYWTIIEHSDYTAERTLNECVANIKAVGKRYGCDVMVVETGMECANDIGGLASAETLEKGRDMLKGFIDQCINNTDGLCKGVFYWEPECRPGQYRLGAFTEDGKPTVIMDAFKKQ